MLTIPLLTVVSAEFQLTFLAVSCVVLAVSRAATLHYLRYFTGLQNRHVHLGTPAEETVRRRSGV